MRRVSNLYWKDDVGNVIGAEDYKKLMDEIPNKIKNNM
jgi:ATP-dependent DNA helicase RecG